MKLKVFTFRFSDSANGFDEKPLQEFIADKEVIDFSEHFFFHEKTPYLAILISYRSLNYDEKKRDRSQDPRKELDDREKQAYDALRNWRAARARQEGIPPYMIANNKQLAKIIKLRSTNKATLARVEGIGESKIAKYGDEILHTIAGHLAPEAAKKPDTDKEIEL